MVVGAVHGEVVVDAKARRSHRLHRRSLVEDILERREVVFEPGIAQIGVAQYGFGHVVRVGRYCPRADGNPRAVLLTEELVDRHAGGLAHQVVHRRAQGQRGLVADPLEGIAAEVLVDDLLRLGAAALAESAESAIGVSDVDCAAGGAVVVVERVGDPVAIGDGDLVDLDLDDVHVSPGPAVDRMRSRS